MRARFVRAAGAGVLSLVLGACPGFGTLEPDIKVNDSSCETVQNILQVRCARCHGETPSEGAMIGLRLDIFEDTPNAIGIHRARSMVLATINNGTMPPPRTMEGSVRASEREAIRDWINAGANYDSCRSEGADVGGTDASDAGFDVEIGRDITFPDAPAPTLDELYETIIEPTCGSHHLSGRTAPWLANDEGLRARLLEASEQVDMPLITPGEPLNSYFMHKLWGTHRDVGGIGQIMPIGPDLSDEEIDAVARWIAAGAE